MAYDEIPKTVAAESSGQGLYELLKNLENKLITHRASVKVDNNASVPGTASGLFVFLQDGVGVRVEERVGDGCDRCAFAAGDEVSLTEVVADRDAEDAGDRPGVEQLPGHRAERRRRLWGVADRLAVRDDER